MRFCTGTTAWTRTPEPHAVTNLGLARRHCSAETTETGTCLELQYAWASAGVARDFWFAASREASLSNSAVQAPPVNNGGIKASHTRATTARIRAILRAGAKVRVERESQAIPKGTPDEQLSRGKRQHGVRNRQNCQRGFQPWTNRSQRKQCERQDPRNELRDIERSPREHLIGAGRPSEPV